MDYLKDRIKYMDMDVDTKRAEYDCQSGYITLDEIPSWTEYSRSINRRQFSSAYRIDERLNGKVSIFSGDITTLEIDVIVNSASSSLVHASYNQINGAISRAAGPSFLAECLSLGVFQTGETKFTGGYKLPARYVIHTQGPNGEHHGLLKKCYMDSLNLAKLKGWKTIVFPCISMGSCRYPRERAARIALKVTREFLEKNPNAMDRVIFCLSEQMDKGIYEFLMQEYFPL
ncbi:ADP-ribose glycohydrolase MACROD2-like isoform X1 [Argiope bruennichi]|uniref:ADP-ribose glycohydrolase MACROD2-like isoform X1 n=1 Tax=Argiope bruennichi TaxID=94029 RepID=UPI002494058C|nr:ADP-ribose glycohydrolase MACROD2-like isoform X1 [Argiope bruennichi]XP_055941002.1 ADP-ribose glycohydrolase MACROD2-like isoform X1 [Argiope bruennichi]XP_055941011.1 ADP-ribose glycohydrolase MACROD2-like isoform X1 [Argiope bruennichi]